LVITQVLAKNLYFVLVNALNYLTTILEGKISVMECLLSTDY
jgi:hypothetical protein